MAEGTGTQEGTAEGNHTVLDEHKRRNQWGESNWFKKNPMTNRRKKQKQKKPERQHFNKVKKTEYF